MFLTNNIKRHTLLCIFLLALIVRLIWNFVFLAPSVRNWDAADFDILAWRFAQGHGFSYLDGFPVASRPPLFPMILSLFYMIFGRGIWVGAILQAIIGALVAPLAAAYAQEATGNRRASVIAGIIGALYLALVDSGSTLLSEPLTIVLVLAAGFMLERGRERSFWYMIIPGALLGLCALTRPNLAPLLLVIPLRLLIIGSGWRKSILSLLVAGSAMALVLAPWTIRNFTVFERPVFVSTQGGHTFWRYGHRLEEVDDSATSPFPHAETTAVKGWIASDGPAELYMPIFMQGNLFYARSYGWEFYRKFEGLNDAQADALFYSMGWQFCKENPMLALKVSLKNSLRFFTPIIEQNVTRLPRDPYDIAWGVLLPLWFFSLFFWTKGDKRKLVFALCTTLVIFLTSVLFTTLARYRLPGEVLMIPVVACGISSAWEKGRKRMLLIVLTTALVLNILAATQVDRLEGWLREGSTGMVGAKTSE